MLINLEHLLCWCWLFPCIAISEEPLTLSFLLKMLWPLNSIFNRECDLSPGWLTSTLGWVHIAVWAREGIKMCYKLNLGTCTSVDAGERNCACLSAWCPQNWSALTGYSFSIVSQRHGCKCLCVCTSHRTLFSFLFMFAETAVCAEVGCLLDILFKCNRCFIRLVICWSTSSWFFAYLLCFDH